MTALLSRHYWKYFVPKTRVARNEVGSQVLKRKYAEFLLEYWASPEAVQTAFDDLTPHGMIPEKTVLEWLEGPNPSHEEALTINIEAKKEADRRRKREI